MGTHRLIYIRTDGNSQIASGHLVRCFSIALACRKLGMEVCFLVSDKESEGLLKSILGTNNGFPIHRLKTAAFNHLEQEIPEVTSLLEKAVKEQAASRSVIYFLDSYYVTEQYLAAVNFHAKTAYLDDLSLFDYSVNLLVNYDVIPYAKLSSYKAAYQNAGQLLLGAAYAPIRPQFQNTPISVRENVTDVLITTGAGDSCHFSLSLIQQVTASSGLLDAPGFSDINFHLVIGKLNTDKEKLYPFAEKYPFLKLYENISDMAALMRRCDLAVSAAGTTLYELCVLGIPSISFAMADNQLSSARAFDEAGAIPFAGDIRIDPQKAFQKIFLFLKNNICFSIDSYQNRKAVHKTMNSLVDGNGALRIAEALKKL